MQMMMHYHYARITAGILAVAALLGTCRPAPAQNAQYRQGAVVTFGVPTVPGIRQAPIGGYDGIEAGEPARPLARIRHTWEPAPPNGCLRPAFEAVSGPHALRGCYGGP